ncbi:hypothetical protein CAPTEDRAFT_215363 [Capitella teleta]|uniref:Uncharacterized protein n=1 Tax=Capitella teleta TaxID=283909 RepID=R7UY98_CAPTE|nr:hypothetical protein CAPTEDRAFT_215363 [Capitella teleta]|eukprot:ELU11553.1 hypothetical protein CAPTEDRAFT_215363 [Capitella teleta]
MGQNGRTSNAYFAKYTRDIRLLEIVGMEISLYYKQGGTSVYIYSYTRDKFQTIMLPRRGKFKPRIQFTTSELIEPCIILCHALYEAAVFSSTEQSDGLEMRFLPASQPSTNPSMKVQEAEEWRRVMIDEDEREII